MLSKRDYWTITSLILVVVLLFQLINAASRSGGLDGLSREESGVVQELEEELSVGEENG